MFRPFGSASWGAHLEPNSSPTGNINVCCDVSFSLGFFVILSDALEMKAVKGRLQVLKAVLLIPSFLCSVFGSVKATKVVAVV